jgi:hypothetical protein
MVTTTCGLAIFCGLICAYYLTGKLIWHFPPCKNVSVYFDIMLSLISAPVIHYDYFDDKNSIFSSLTKNKQLCLPMAGQSFVTLWLR